MWDEGRCRFVSIVLVLLRPGDVALRNLGFNLENVLKHARALV